MSPAARIPFAPVAARCIGRPCGTLTLLLAAWSAGCGGAAENQTAAYARSRGVQTASDGTSASTSGRCDANAPNREVSEYDTSGDDVPDVRKVFLQVGRAPLIRLVLICREADLNGDGTKDVVRYYNDEGRPLREEADRNFDGQMDEVIFFEDGRVSRSETDTTGDGKVDTKVFYERGQPVRTERDLAGRSTADRWRPDRWEYFQEGRLVRAGVDLDGDGVVDRWDRDETMRRGPDSTRDAAEAASDTGAEPPPDAPAPTAPAPTAPAPAAPHRAGTRG